MPGGEGHERGLGTGQKGSTAEPSKEKNMAQFYAFIIYLVMLSVYKNVHSRERLQFLVRSSMKLQPSC
jgi:hypothetical protein